jgi:glycosyltransferase involved in cell wall biosynthesis
VFVGGLEPVKNPDLLVRAFARIADRTARDLEIVGEGSMAEELRELAIESGVDARVRFAGGVPRESIQDVFDHAFALILPSRSEGMPIVVNEALATGTPVIASDVGGISELVTSERFGILVPPNDEEALANAMLVADTREWDAAEIARDAPIISWRENAARVIALYERVTATAEPVGRRDD